MKGRRLNSTDHCAHPHPGRQIRIRCGREVWHLTAHDLPERGSVTETLEELARLMQAKPQAVKA